MFAHPTPKTDVYVMRWQRWLNLLHALETAKATEAVRKDKAEHPEFYGEEV